ncbi:MAG: hypothetical protein ACPL6C_01720 [bacterium]
MKKILIFLLVLAGVILIIRLLVRTRRAGEEFSTKYIEKPTFEALKAYQAEAKENLMLIANKEQAFFSEYGHYTLSIDSLGFSPPIRSKYLYKIEMTTEKSFTARATGNIDNDKTLDEWVINENGVIQNVVDDISN